jgi:hypothetical protein
MPSSQTLCYETLPPADYAVDVASLHVFIGKAQIVKNYIQLDFPRFHFST